MGKQTIKAGIVGTGFSASFHVTSLRRVHGVDVEIVGAFSPPPEERRSFCARNGVNEIESIEEVIDKADVVHVCTPPVTHESIAIAALKAGKNVIVEKPFTGYFGDGSDSFNGDTFPRENALTGAIESIKRMRDAEAASSGRIFYAENWVYAPAIQKEREILEKTKGQILWIHGEEAHSGSHSRFYGIWAHSGGGSLIGKGVHPLSAAIYLKHVEGRATGRPIRPVRVSANVHKITRSENFKDIGVIRTGYTDVEDFAHLHIVFSDDTFADIFASEIVMGGINNWLQIMANNHRGVVNINPNTAFMSYNPTQGQFDDIYVVEKIETKEGWAFTSPDEDWVTGYHQEMEAFYNNATTNTAPESGSALGADTIACVYAGYLSAERGGASVAVPEV